MYVLMFGLNCLVVISTTPGVIVNSQPLFALQ